jgi:hypothetical protein
MTEHMAKYDKQLINCIIYFSGVTYSLKLASLHSLNTNYNWRIVYVSDLIFELSIKLIILVLKWMTQFKKYIFYYIWGISCIFCHMFCHQLFTFNNIQLLHLNEINMRFYGAEYNNIERGEAEFIIVVICSTPNVIKYVLFELSHPL